MGRKRKRTAKKFRRKLPKRIFECPLCSFRTLTIKKQAGKWVWKCGHCGLSNEDFDQIRLPIWAEAVDVACFIRDGIYENLYKEASPILGVEVENDDTNNR